MSLLTLPSGEAHLWYALPDELTSPALVAAYGELMAPEERERQRRYVFEKNRHEYLVTRALVRTVLSRYAPVAPKAWTFQAGHYGKPDIASPMVAPRLRFNLSNTTGLVACLVTVGREVGVDAEELERAGRALDVADRFFSPLKMSRSKSSPSISAATTAPSRRLRQSLRGRARSIPPWRAGARSGALARSRGGSSRPRRP